MTLPPDFDPAAELALAQELADLGNAVAMPLYESREFSLDRKADRSEVTEADRNAELAISRRVLEARPHHGMYGEEHGVVGDASSPWRWVVDPIDGTSNFVRGIPVSYDPATCTVPPAFADRLTPGTPPTLTPDGTLDSFTGVEPGCLVSFQIVVENDGFVAATCTDQIFNVPIIVVGDGTAEADRRQIIVRVPGDRTLCAP